MTAGIIMVDVIVGMLIALFCASLSLLDSNDLGNSEGDISDFADGSLEVKEFRKRINPTAKKRRE